MQTENPNREQPGQENDDQPKNPQPGQQPNPPVQPADDKGQAA